MFLPDVNLWLALAFESHIHHAPAKRWFESFSSEGCSFCRMTQQGFLRLATNPQAFEQETATLSEAWEIYDLFLADPYIFYSEEPAQIEQTWRKFTQGQVFSPKVWNDAFLAAFATTGNFHLVTFDVGFRRFAELNHTILS
jgi:toxin-antitoxin system PIN domain toxin